MINYKIILEYDGSKYNGWQRQGNTSNTIQGRLETILSRYFEQDIEVHGSGRTDAGVHALGQVANFKIRPEIMSTTIDLYDISTLKTSINSFLPEDIRIVAMEVADQRFHARLNAKSKLYRYRICLCDKRNVFERKYCAQISTPLDFDLMKLASNCFLGEHDFGCFSDTKTKKSTVRRVDSITFTKEVHNNDTYLNVDFRGNGFLYHTVRLMMGTLLKIGANECSADIIGQIFATNNRKLIPYMAPAEGLFLVEVTY